MTTRLTRRDLLRAAGAAVALPAVSAAAPASALDRLLDRRRMVRRFKADDVPEHLVRALLATAARAPSAGHTQPWAFLVVRQRERRMALAHAAYGQTFVGTAPVVIVVCAELARSRAKYAGRGERYAIIDAGFASLLLLLAVTEHDLGACFVGAFDDAEVARLLRLPPDVQPIALIPVGHPAEAPRSQKLRPLATVVHFERWGRATDEPGPSPRP